MTLHPPKPHETRLHTANNVAAEMFQTLAELRRQLSLAPRRSEDIARITELAIQVAQKNRELQNHLDLVAADMRRRESGIREASA